IRLGDPGRREIDGVMLDNRQNWSHCWFKARRRSRRRAVLITTAPFLLHSWQHFELVERRRRRQRPFQRGRTGSPRIVRSLLLAHEGIDHAVYEDQHAAAGA